MNDKPPKRLLKYLEYKRKGGMKDYSSFYSPKKRSERQRILNIISVYQNMFHYTTKEYKLLTDLISKI